MGMKHVRDRKVGMTMHIKLYIREKIENTNGRGRNGRMGNGM